MKIREQRKRNHRVKPHLWALLFFALSMIIPVALPAAELIHHSIKATLLPADHRISVVDSVTLPEGSPREVRFTLHSGLRPVSTTSGVQIVKQGERQEAV